MWFAKSEANSTHLDFFIPLLGNKEFQMRTIAHTLGFSGVDHVVRYKYGGRIFSGPKGAMRFIES